MSNRSIRQNCALIVAGGKGKRMGKGINKLFLKLKNKPILAYTLGVFERCELIDTIVLVAAKEEIPYCKSEIILKYGITKVKNIVAGGTERQQSVLNGLREIDDGKIVLIHDGARPFIDEKIIKKGIQYAEMYGACACGVEPKDTIKIRTEDGFSKAAPKRSELFCVQTPQCFKSEIIKEAHEKILKEKIIVTDDTMVAEYAGHRVYLFEGSYENIKITTPEDIFLGENILEKIVKH